MKNIVLEILFCVPICAEPQINKDSEWNFSILLICWKMRLISHYCRGFFYFLFFYVCVTIPSGCAFERWLMENAICRRLIYSCYLWKAADLVPTTSYLKSSAWMMTALTTFISTANAQMGVIGLRANGMSWDFPFFFFLLFQHILCLPPINSTYYSIWEFWQESQSSKFEAALE